MRNRYTKPRDGYTLGERIIVAAWWIVILAVFGLCAAVVIAPMLHTVRP